MLDAVCAGHVCLDLVPTFLSRPSQLSDIFMPGKLTDIGWLQIAAGGSVINTGIAFSKFGLSTAIMARVGNDDLGKLTSEALENEGVSAKHLTTQDGGHTSYSIVLAVPGYDRMFLQDAGANREFCIDDIDFDLVKEAKLLHLGYITHLEKLYEHDGEMLEEILRKAKECGATTSIDTALPDLNSEAARCDWDRILARCLPYTDVFCPSIEELLFVSDPSEYWRLHDMDWDILHNVSMDQISAIASRMIGMGAKIVYLKCGYLGVFLKTAPKNLFRDGGRAFPKDVSNWTDRELFSPPFRVREVKSTIGAGGVAIAGFLSGMMEGDTVEESLTIGAAAAAYCVRSLSAVGELVDIPTMKDRVARGWDKLSINYIGPVLTYDPQTRLYTDRRTD